MRCAKRQLTRDALRTGSGVVVLPTASVTLPSSALEKRRGEARALVADRGTSLWYSLPFRNEEYDEVDGVAHTLVFWDCAGEISVVDEVIEERLVEVLVGAQVGG